jgi:hypothetical protein
MIPNVRRRKIPSVSVLINARYLLLGATTRKRADAAPPGPIEYMTAARLFANSRRTRVTATTKGEHRYQIRAGAFTCSGRKPMPISRTVSGAECFRVLSITRPSDQSRSLLARSRRRCQAALSPRENVRGPDRGFRYIRPSEDKFALFDAGGLCWARLLEPFGLPWIHLALGHRPDRDNAFAYLA